LTVTLGVAWALFILAPGLAVFAALYTSGGGKVGAPAPPAPNSFTALSIVIFGALTAHAAAALLLIERSQIKNVALQVVFQRKPSPRPADGTVV
jgi:hypothetical protein